MSLRELYQEIIVDHGKHPRHFAKLEEANHCHLGHNPLCGDKLTIYLCEKDGIVQKASFDGVGCAISIASASLMIESITGKSLTEIEQLFQGFHLLVTEGKQSAVNLGKLEVFSGVALFPIRVKCATLAWHTLKAALGNNPNPVTTE